MSTQWTNQRPPLGPLEEREKGLPDPVFSSIYLLKFSALS